mgnify:CR=1 FL=1
MKNVKGENRKWLARGFYFFSFASKWPLSFPQNSVLSHWRLLSVKCHLTYLKKIDLFDIMFYERNRGGGRKTEVLKDKWKFFQRLSFFEHLFSLYFNCNALKAKIMEAKCMSSRSHFRRIYLAICEVDQSPEILIPFPLLMSRIARNQM